MFLSLIRIVKFSFQDIFRNIWLSLVTVIILILALFTVNILLVVKVVGNTAVDAIKQKIDVNLESINNNLTSLTKLLHGVINLKNENNFYTMDLNKSSKKMIVKIQTKLNDVKQMIIQLK